MFGQDIGSVSARGFLNGSPTPKGYTALSVQIINEFADSEAFLQQTRYRPGSRSGARALDDGGAGLPGGRTDLGPGAAFAYGIGGRRCQERIS